MTAPRVSAILVSYNYGRFLARSIRSVLEQDYPRERIELIVVDDGSTDDTPEVAQSFAEEIRYIRQRNGGLLNAVNRGLGEATGDYIAFQSGDDIWLPDKLRVLTDVLERRPEVGLAYGDMAVIDSDDALLHPSFMAQAKITPRRGNVGGHLVRSNFISGGALLARASLKARFHPLPDYAGWEDWWVAARVAEVSEVEFVPVAVHGYRFHGENMNLGASPEKAAKVAAAEVPFRRWLLTDFGADGIDVSDLASGCSAFAYCAQVKAAQLGCSLRDAVGVSAADIAAAEAAVAAALAAEERADHSQAAQLAARAFGWDPETARAAELITALHQRSEAERARISPPWKELRADAFVTFAAAQELVSDPGLLTAYGDAFAGRPDATLLIALPAAEADAVAGELVAAVAEAGLDGEDSPDMLACVVADSDHHALMPLLSAVLSSRPLSGPLGTVVRADAASIGAFGRWSEAALHSRA